MPEVLHLWLLCGGDLDDLIGSGSTGAGLEPVDGQQGFEFVGGGVAHQLVEDPLEPGEGIGSVTTELLDEGVDDGTAPTGVLTADEPPVLVTEFGGADRVLS